jgi:hypothetical protein
MDGWPGPPPKWYDYGVILKLLLALLLLWALLAYGLRYPFLLAVTIIIVALLALVAIAHVLSTVVAVGWASRWGRTRSVQATVARKWTRGEDYSIGVPVEKPFAFEGEFASPQEELGVTVPGGMGFWVAFRTGAREEKFSVPESLYVELEEGVKGVLTYRGERFLSFVPLDRPERPDGEHRGPSGWRPGPHLNREP